MFATLKLRKNIPTNQLINSKYKQFNRFKTDSEFHRNIYTTSLLLNHSYSEEGKLNFTGIVNNANLGIETTVEDILQGLKKAEEFSSVTNLPVKFTAVRRDLAADERIKRLKQVLSIDPIKYGDWL